MTLASWQKAAASFWYLSSRMVRGVAMTITEELPTSRAAGFTAGSMPMMGRSGWAWRRRWMAALVAVLQATTTAFTPWARSRSTAAMVRRRTWARDFSP